MSTFECTECGWTVGGVKSSECAKHGPMTKVSDDDRVQGAWLQVGWKAAPYWGNWGAA